MAVVTPLERQCELESYYPAGSAVKPPPRKAAGTIAATRETAQRKRMGESDFKCESF